jgi:16S rRNA (cytosine967-C5)-methyltransferase
MPEPAVLSHAARVLSAIGPTTPADAALRGFLVNARRLQPPEKRAVSQAVFAYFRWLQWLDDSSVQQQLEHAWELHQCFRRNEKSVKPEALAARAVPRWLHEEMDVTADFVRALQRDPVLWLRARPGTAARLARELGDCLPAMPALKAAPGEPRPASGTLPGGNGSSLVPDALRYTGTQDLFLTPAFHRGAFEIQDLSSQLVGHACAPKSSETWWDACAGEGGKTLHLADLMLNKGLVWASDRNERRLQVLRRRAARAQLFNYRAVAWDGSPRLPAKTRFDGILVAAPCSGVGTWQRNPHSRWDTTLKDVHELAAVQRTLLENVAGAVKPGGRLVYSVCTLTRSETTAVADGFSHAHPEYAPEPLLRTEPRLMLWPHELDANGMFIAAWRRSV